jgi:hypothetical protein
MQATNTTDFMMYIKSLPFNTNMVLECPNCHASFERKKSIIQSKFGNHNKNKTIYCSHKCATLSKITSQNVNCKQCNSIFSKTNKQIIKYPNHFCSRSCATTYNNTHKTKGNRKSKLEIWLEAQLPALYPNLEFIFNGKETINSELDIYIPSLQLAFELNGIFHYEPIYGSDKLSSIQNNDNRKFQACLEKNIELVIIDSSGQKYFKPSSSEKYLQIIKQIIDSKLSQ